MSDDTRFEPEPYQVVSDLGQLQAFNDPMKISLLRILQRQEATTEQLASMIGEGPDVVAGHVRMLQDLRLVRIFGEQDGNGHAESTYRATARIYDLQPEPVDNPQVMAPVAGATLESVKQDVVASLTHWPDQVMNFESRRLRMSQAKAMEFNDKLVELLAEYWGDPEHPTEEDPDESVMAFAGIWYRFPDRT